VDGASKTVAKLLDTMPRSQVNGSSE